MNFGFLDFSRKLYQASELILDVWAFFNKVISSFGINFGLLMFFTLFSHVCHMFVTLFSHFWGFGVLSMLNTGMILQGLARWESCWDVTDIAGAFTKSGGHSGLGTRIPGFLYLLISYQRYLDIGTAILHRIWIRVCRT